MTHTFWAYSQPPLNGAAGWLAVQLKGPRKKIRAEPHSLLFTTLAMFGSHVGIVVVVSIWAKSHKKHSTENNTAAQYDL